MMKPIRTVVAAALLGLTLAACSATGTADSTSLAVFTRPVPSWLEGRWTMRGRFALSCTYEFTGTRLGGTSAVYAVEKPGYCTSAFEHVAGWRALGRNLILTDMNGDRLVRLERQADDTYAGRFRGGLLGSYDVVMRRGRF